jgi:hypothetical protein
MTYDKVDWGSSSTSGGVMAHAKASVDGAAPLITMMVAVKGQIHLGMGFRGKGRV